MMEPSKRNGSKGVAERERQISADLLGELRALDRPGRNECYHAIKTNQFGFIHHTNLVESVSGRTNRPALDRLLGCLSTERREIAIHQGEPNQRRLHPSR